MTRQITFYRPRPLLAPTFTSAALAVATGSLAYAQSALTGDERTILALAVAAGTYITAKLGRKTGEAAGAWLGEKFGRVAAARARITIVNGNSIPPAQREEIAAQARETVTKAGGVAGRGLFSFSAMFLGFWAGAGLGYYYTNDIVTDHLRNRPATVENARLGSR